MPEASDQNLEAATHAIRAAADHPETLSEYVALLERACRDHPDSAEFAYRLAAELQSSAPTRALELARRTIDHEHDNPGTLINAGEILCSAGDVDGALLAAKRAYLLVDTEPIHEAAGSLMYLYGVIAGRRGMTAEMLECFEAAFDWDPTHRTFGFMLATVLRVDGDEERAQRAAQRALQGRPGDARLTEFLAERT
ncbi:hypothetical protein DSM112329_02884 [Paraconexibacter sp. AEG42_29]|uniref:Tetratricopeptide repeat protein n=1 Tax=Paraconexibacter sp. AEG42_29 TaxID=2997339 RepID=A0AAU7AWJ7_9ACTN